MATGSGSPEPGHPHGVDHYDATFTRDLLWSQRLREQLNELPTAAEPDHG